MKTCVYFIFYWIYTYFDTFDNNLKSSKLKRKPCGWEGERIYLQLDIQTIDHVRISPVTNLSCRIKKPRARRNIFFFNKKRSRISHSGAETAHSDTLDALRINNILLAIAFSSIANTSIGIYLSIFLSHFSIFARRIVDDFPRWHGNFNAAMSDCDSFRIVCTYTLRCFIDWKICFYIFQFI